MSHLLAFIFKFRMCDFTQRSAEDCECNGDASHLRWCPGLNPFEGQAHVASSSPLVFHPALVLWCQLSPESAADAELIKDPGPSWPPLQSQEGAASQEASDWDWWDPAGDQQLSVTMQRLLSAL